MFEYRYNVFDDGELVLSTDSLTNVQQLIARYRKIFGPDRIKEFQVLELIHV